MLITDRDRLDEVIFCHSRVIKQPSEGDSG